MIVFLFISFTVFLTAFLLAYKAFKFSNFIDSLIILFVLCLAQIVAGQLLFGILNALTLNNVIFLNLALLLLAGFTCRKQKYHLAFPGIKKTLGSLLTDRIVILILAVILGFGISKVFINLVNPPFGWDSLNYHFTFAVEWLKHANLNTPITIADDPAPTYYPINGSLVFLWLIWPFKNVFLADLGQLPFFILAFLCVYGISRKIGLEEKLSLFAAGLFLLIPNYFKQLQIAYVDVMVTALFLVCLNFLLLLNENFSAKLTLAYAIGMGLLFGTKTVALPYCVLLTVPFLYMLCKNFKKINTLIIFLIVVVCLGGFSYLRNFIETGNPLYPLNLKLFGKEIFRGVMDSNIFRAHFKIDDYRIGKLLFHEGLGLQTVIFVFPAAFLALLVSLLKSKGRLKFILIYFLALPFLGYLVYRYVIPLANTRYLYPVLATGMIAGFYLFKIMRIPVRLINFFVVLSILASMPELAKRQELIVSLVLTFSLLFLIPLALKYEKKTALFRKPAFIIFLAAFFVSFLWLAQIYYKRNEFPNYVKMVKYSGFWPDAVKAWAWLNENTHSTNIAYTGRPVPFPLYGSNFKNNVYYVSVNKTEPAKLHYFPGSHYNWGYDFESLHKNLEEKANYRGNADYSAWLNNLLKRNTDYLFIYSLHQTKRTEFPIEDKWAAGDPGRFTPVFRNETIRIYAIIHNNPRS
jgi:hypothetical protein